MLGSLDRINRITKKIDRWLPPAPPRAVQCKYADPVQFAKSLGFAADPWQESVLRMDSQRMLLNCSRQAGKSTVTALAATYQAIAKPDRLILLVSPSLRQSGELFRKVSNWVHKAGLELIEDNKLSCTLANGSRIISLPSSEATIRGFSKVDLIIEDEASRVDDSLYYSIRPMLAVSKGGILLMSTPFGKRGHFYQEWNAGGDQWQRIEVPAAQVPRISPEFLEQERKSLGEWWYQQEYCCHFMDAIDSLFTHDLVEAAFGHDIRPLFGEEESGIAPLFGEAQ